MLFFLALIHAEPLLQAGYWQRSKCLAAEQMPGSGANAWRWQTSFTTDHALEQYTVGITRRSGIAKHALLLQRHLRMRVLLSWAEDGEHLLPDAGVTPALVAPVDRVPRTELCR